VRKFQICLAFCVGVAAFASFAKPAQAALIEFDFTDFEMFGDLNGQTSFGPITIAGFQISFSASGRMTTNARDRGGCVAGKGSTHDLTCDGDGLGIGNDEITFNRDRLTVILDWAGSYRITAIEFLDLFRPEGGQSEFAQYEINGGGLNSVVSQSLTGGYVYEPNGSILSGSARIDFLTTLNRRSDFALARIFVETEDRNLVPEPPILGLLLSGFVLVGLFFWRRAEN